MNTNSNSVRFGFVLWFDETKNTGRLKVDGELQEVVFSFDSQRVVVEGATVPQFGKEAPKETIIPQSGSQVVVALKVYYNPTQTAQSFGLRRVVEAAGWNFAFEWQDAQKRIAKRPVYEVMEFLLLKGEPLAGEAPRVTVVGTVEEIQAKFPRGAQGDPLAPEKKALDLLYRRTFFLRKDGKTVRCSDPRPLPKGAVAVTMPAAVVAEPPKPVNGNGDSVASDAEIFALAASVNGQRTGTSTLPPARTKT